MGPRAAVDMKIETSIKAGVGEAEQAGAKPKP
jgi:hypothetical protein